MSETDNEATIEQRENVIRHLVKSINSKIRKSLLKIDENAKLLNYWELRDLAVKVSKIEKKLEKISK